MPIKATFFTGPDCLQNRQFDIHDSRLNHDNNMYGFYLLKNKLAQRGIDLSTHDINPPEESQFVLFNEMPQMQSLAAGKKNYLLILEAAIIRKDNWDLKRHQSFDKIFTGHDDFIDNKKYFKVNFPCKIDPVLDINPNVRNKFCTLIAGNKYFKSPLELYSRRIEAIRWFEKNHPGDFDLYGIGWDAPLTPKIVVKSLLQLNPGRIIHRKFPSYRGTVKSKMEVLHQYKFSICYENARDIPGYITEKIIHCLQAGCIPVYWGAPNIDAHISPKAFINFKNFKNYQELYAYLKGMPEQEYLDYLAAIKDFINSERAHPFSADFFADQIATNILKDRLQTTTS